MISCSVEVHNADVNDSAKPSRAFIKALECISKAGD